MSDLLTELRQRFGARFFADSPRRLILAGSELDDSGDAEIARRELHALAGEAALLGYGEISAAASDSDRLFERWYRERSDSAKVQCAERLATLRELLERERELPSWQTMTLTPTPTTRQGEDPHGC